MHMNIDVDLDYRLAAPGAAILTLEVADTAGQQIRASDMRFDPPLDFRRVTAEEGIGQRIMAHVEDRLSLRYRAEIEVTRPRPDLARMQALPVHDLPGEALRHMLPSRYCEAHRFLHFTASRFQGLTGGPLVVALRDWVEDQLDYVPGVSTGDTTAADTFTDRRGVCRDYAHLLIALCRAGQVPARIASVYAPPVNPQDFHAVAQVFLDGDWHLVDPTGMAEADGMALVAVGRDATDVAFLTTITDAQMDGQQVAVRQIL
ncbi:MAG: transglutaminase-like domain-containing protein [Paracoccus sp. (in: a-proteobacteria)]